MRRAARFSFAPDLNEFLAPASRRTGEVEIAFDAGQTVKHLIESAGVPHTEVGNLRANGSSVTLDYRVQDGDTVGILPAAEASDPLPGEARFVLDNHLGRLAAYLRMLGFDSLYRNNYDDAELAQVSAEQERILLTRNRRLLMRKQVRYGYCLRSLDSREQLTEVLRRYALFDRITPFRRCLRCNTPLEETLKTDVVHMLQPLTRQYYQEFHRCPACGKVYWKGSHFEHMQAIIDEIRGNHQGK